MPDKCLDLQLLGCSLLWLLPALLVSLVLFLCKQTPSHLNLVKSTSSQSRYFPEIDDLQIFFCHVNITSASDRERIHHRPFCSFVSCKKVEAKVERGSVSRFVSSGTGHVPAARRHHDTVCPVCRVHARHFVFWRSPVHKCSLCALAGASCIRCAKKNSLCV